MCNGEAQIKKIHRHLDRTPRGALQLNPRRAIQMAVDFSLSSSAAKEQ
jgi:hypothetical protein